MHATLVVKGPPSTAVAEAGRHGLITTVERTLGEGGLITETVLRTAPGTTVMLREVAVLVTWMGEPGDDVGMLLAYSLHDERALFS